MTRPSKLLTAESEDDYISLPDKKYVPENSIKYKIYKLIEKNKTDMTLNEVKNSLNISTTRRVYEIALTDLTGTKLIKRVKCRCGCAYIYSRK